MRLRLWTVALAISFAPGLARSQSVLSTILGAPPDGAPALSALLNMPAGVIADGKGNVYVALKSGHQVVRIDKSGIVWQVAGTSDSGSTGDGGPAKLATLSTPVAVALDVSGNLYIADSGANKIRRVGLDGVIATFAGTGVSGSGGDGGLATAARLAAPSALAFDKNGNLLIADTGNHVIRMVTPSGVISTVVGNGFKGSLGNGGPALQASLNNPAGVLADKTGNIYVSDYGNKWVRVVSPAGTISLYAGVASTSAPAGDTTLALNTVLTGPTSLAMDQAGSLYIAEYGVPRIVKVTSDGKISSYAGTGVSGGSGDGGLARFANLNVVGIAFDGNNNLLIADGVNNRVRIVTTADGIIDTLAGNGISSYSPRGGMILKGSTLYFSDAASHRVRAFNTTTGELSQVAGDGVASYWGDGASALDASLNNPRGLAFDGAGNLYIADSGNHRIRRVTSAGIITTVVGTGTASTTGDGAAATAATVHEPAGVAVDASGNLYIAERSGHVVRKVTPAGIISTVAGTGVAGAPGAESGAATSQKLNFPQGLSWDLTGSLLIADSGNNRIRRLTSDGTITTVAGSSNAGFGGDGGPAASATLYGPSGAAVDTAGNLYIADTNNNRIRRVATSGLITTVAGNGLAAYNGDGSPATAVSLSAPSAIVAGSGGMLIADTANKRIRQLTLLVPYMIGSNPQGLQVAVDGQVTAAPLVVDLLPGTSHQLDAPSPQSGAAGTRYVLSGIQTLSVATEADAGSATLGFTTQYALSIGSDHGGAVSSAASWQDAGSAVTLSATPKAGFLFAGWEGDCAGAGSCRLQMTGPRSVKADFAPAQVLGASISSGGVVGAGLSTPPVSALSPNAIAIVFGSGFAPAGTLSVAGADNLVNGRIPTELDGVCVLVGATWAPILAVTPTQINFQAPGTLAPGKVPVEVVTGCGTAYEARSGAELVASQSASPEFFYFVHGTSGQNPIAAVNASSGVYVGAPGLTPGASFVPAKPGDVLTLFATGLGLTNPALGAGVLPAAAAAIAGDFHIYVGSTELAATDVLYAGVATSNAGLYQINIRLPATTPDGDLPVRMTVNGIPTPPGGYITVKQ